jgi:hypothetical protein
MTYSSSERLARPIHYLVNGNNIINQKSTFDESRLFLDIKGTKTQPNVLANTFSIVPAKI